MALRCPNPFGQLPLPFLVPFAARVNARCIRSITKPAKPNNKFNSLPGLPVLEASAAAAHKRKEYTLPPRTGVLGIKKGMSAVYDPETGRREACTLVQLDRVQVVAHKTHKRDGYFAVQVGYGARLPSNLTRPVLGHYEASAVPPKRGLVEFRVRDRGGLVPVGSVLTASWFRPGQFVDARANCRGMGFAGGMKRHGFAGQPASHGTSLTHRAMGSAGQSQGGGSRVLPGKKMPGRMGGQQVTVQNVKVLQVDEQNGLVVLKGCISGPKGCVVKLQDALKKPWPEIHPLGPFANQQSSESAAQTAA